MPTIARRVDSYSRIILELGKKISCFIGKNPPIGGFYLDEA